MLYKNNNYESLDQIANIFCEDFTKELKGKTIESVKYGKGKIEAFNNLVYTLDNSDIHILINFESIGKTLSFALKHSLEVPKGIKINDEIENSINTYLGELDHLYADWKDSELEKLAIKKAEEDRIIAEKKAEEKRIKNEIKYERHKAEMLKQFEKLCHGKLTSGDEYFVSLGYIAKHAKNIIVALPDYLETDFVREFGDVKRRVVDSKKVGPAGYVSQWGLSMRILLDTNLNIPKYLQRYLGKTNNEIQPISDTAFICGLLKNSGFKVGKTQNIDDILDSVPSQNLESFQLGYSL